jgi:hypothetical protein
MTPDSATHSPPFSTPARTVLTAAVIVASVVAAVINQLDFRGGVYRLQLIENARPAWHAG